MRERELSRHLYSFRLHDIEQLAHGGVVRPEETLALVREVRRLRDAQRALMQEIVRHAPAALGEPIAQMLAESFALEPQGEEHRGAYCGRVIRAIDAAVSRELVATSMASDARLTNQVTRRLCELRPDVDAALRPFSTYLSKEAAL